MKRDNLGHFHRKYVTIHKIAITVPVSVGFWLKYMSTKELFVLILTTSCKVQIQVIISRGNGHNIGNQPCLCEYDVVSCAFCYTAFLSPNQAVSCRLQLDFCIFE